MTLKETKSNKSLKRHLKRSSPTTSTTEILLELGLKDKIAGMLNPDNAVTDKYKDAIEAIPHIGDKNLSHKKQFSYEPDALMGRKHDVF